MNRGEVDRVRSGFCHPITDPCERTLRCKGNGGSHEHGSGILAHCNGGRSCSVGRGASLRSYFYPHAAQEPRQKSLVIAAEKPRHVERETGLVVTSGFCPARPGSYTWRSASAGHQLCVSSPWQSVISSARARRPNRASALRQGPN